jgi:glycerol-1-phosphate dehydrogenase [NAD(P)+]
MDINKKIEESLKYATETKVFVLGEKVLGRTPAIFKEQFPGRDAIIVADKNTWRVAGEEVYGYMVAAGIKCFKHIIEKDEFHADWEYVEEVEAAMKSTGAIAVAVGSGTINDLCKCVAFRLKDKYMCVVTASSVDGYSSSGAVITIDGLKQTVNSAAPVAIIADTIILANAPKEMTAAGYADLAAKVPAGAEWMIADLFGTEPIIPNAWHILFDVLDELLADPEGVAAGKPDSVAFLFAGLTLSGFAMQVAGSSRPASCTEHLFSHYLDMTGYRYKGKLQSHGFQVAVGTLTMSAFFDEFYKYDLSKLDVDKCVAAWPTLEQEQQRALKVYETFPSKELGYVEMTKKYSDAETVRKQLTDVKNNWFDFKAKLQKQTYTFDKMKHLFTVVGAPTDPLDIGVTREKLLSIVPFTQLMRWRINLLDLCKRAMIYDDIVAKVFGKGGAWEIVK